MTPARIALVAGIVFLAAIVVVTMFALHLGVVLLVAVALVGLIASGNLLYGRRSHYAAAVDRTRPAQEAHDRAADEAAERRKADAVDRRRTRPRQQ